MSKGQDSGVETSAGTMDGLLEVSRSKGRTRIEGEKPKLIAQQFQQGSDLDRALSERSSGGRQRLGEAEEVRTRDTGTGMDDLFGSSQSGRRVLQAQRGSSDLDDLLGPASAPRRDSGGARSDMDDLLGPSAGPRRVAPKAAKDSFDPLERSGARSREPAAPSSLDDLFGPSRKR